MTESEMSKESKEILHSEVSNIATQTLQFDFTEPRPRQRKKSTELQMSKHNPRGMESSALTSYTPLSSSHQSWDLALNEVLGVLRVQYRNDDEVMLFLSDPEKIKQLQYSTAARMEWNRRVIKEEMDSGNHNPMRSRRIAKEVAIDYIRRYLDGEEERITMLKRMQILEKDKDENLAIIIDLEREIKREKDDKMKLMNENDRLSEENSKFKADVDNYRCENLKVRDENCGTKDENERVRGENAKLREENKKLRIENQDLRNENGALRSENQKVRHDNTKLRDESGEMREENMRLRTENQTLRDENQDVRCENLKLRDNNNSLRSENDRFRTTNETLLNENRKVVRENLELHAREDELRMMVNVQLSLLSTKVGSSERSDVLGDGRADDASC